MAVINDQAKEKLKKELKEFEGSQKGKAVSKAVCETLIEFCNRNFFAQAIWDSEKTLSDCCKEITKGVGGSISDFELYAAAVKYYFPGAEVKCKMEITQNEENSEDGKVVSLLDLL